MGLECLKCHASFSSGAYDPKIGCPICNKGNKKVVKDNEQVNKDKKLIGFLKWAHRNYIKLEIGYSADNRIAISILNTEEGEQLHTGFGDTLEEAIEHLQDDISESGNLPIKYDKHRVVYEFPWDK